MADRIARAGHEDTEKLEREMEDGHQDELAQGEVDHHLHPEVQQDWSERAKLKSQQQLQLLPRLLCSEPLPSQPKMRTVAILAIGVFGS